VGQPQLVYLSYRRGKHVYWTRKQTTLHKGEKLLTDGEITARTRCGNQVSALPRAETSPEEPSMAELDRPDALASGMEQPLTLASNSLQVDPGLPLGPSSPGGGFAGGPGVVVPPAIGGGGVVPPIGGNCPPKGTATNCNQQPPPTPPPQPPPPTPVPEPASVVLIVSGAAAIYMRVRSRRS
jgi:hypothetical protein